MLGRFRDPVWRAIGIAVLATVLVAALAIRSAPFGDGESTMVADFVQTYAARTNDERDLLGDVGDVSCREFARYQGEDVFLCEVHYTTDSRGMWCAAVVGGRLLTQDQAKALPCLRRPRGPAPVAAGVSGRA